MKTLGLTLLCIALAACGTPTGAGEQETFRFDPDAKNDVFATGISASVRQDVWEVRHMWTDCEPSTGQSYEEYYRTWLGKIAKDPQWDHTLAFVRADGSKAPMPAVECADTGLALRFFFAQEHGLPMLVQGGHPRKVWGHIGYFECSGSDCSRLVNYRDKYGCSQDAPRGSDSQLARSGWYLGEDSQQWPHESSPIGDYMDTVFTNKCFGYFMQDVWDNLFSGNIVEDWNTYYIRPDAIRAGDVQMHRPGSDTPNGIGHTLTVQEVNWSGRKLSKVQFMVSYMPSYPMFEDGFSELTNLAPDPASHSGLRRYKIPVLSSDGSAWMMQRDESVIRRSSEVSQNPEDFRQLFSLNASEEIESMLGSVRAARQALVANPNSCRRREERERAFDNIYSVVDRSPELRQELGLSADDSAAKVRVAVDKKYRMFDDYVWAALDYPRSWVCHWNPSATATQNGELINPRMYAATVAFNKERFAQQGCSGLRMFRGVDVQDRNAGSDAFDDVESYARAHNFSWSRFAYDPAEGDLETLRGVGTDVTATDESTLQASFCEVFDALSARGAWSN